MVARKTILRNLAFLKQATEKSERRELQADIGRRIRDHRERHDLTQAQLAGHLYTPQHVSLIENGDRMPDARALIHFARS